MTTTQYIKAISLDEKGIKKRSPHIEHERSVAMNDLIEWNHFAIKDVSGPYEITLGTAENRIKITAISEHAPDPIAISLNLAQFRSIIRDYFIICESYFDAVKLGNVPRIEAIDMSRRGLHNEGADLLAILLADKVTMDSDTARRLFTLICVLHLR
ncbi:MAG: UPF0262 family protein [Pseudomonadota bacterium]